MAGPRRQFSLVETEPEVSEALRDHVGGGAAEFFGARPFLPGGRPLSPRVSTAAEWRSCAEQQRPAAGSRLSPEEGLRLK